MQVERATTKVLQEKRLPALDGIRGIAVLGVLLVHAHILLTTTGILEHPLSLLVESGAYGVDLFFVLSGFLITGILLDTRESPRYFRSFYARRFLRLFPVYYGYLLVVAVVLPALHRVAHTSMADYTGGWWWYFGYISNWKPGHGASDPFLGHFWSLAVEEQFYIWWPAMVFLVPRKALGWAFTGIIAIAVLLRITMAAHGTDWNTVYRLTPTRMDALALGAVAALVMRNDLWRERFRKAARIAFVLSAAMFVATVAICGDVTWANRLIQTTGSVAIEIAFTALVFMAALPEDNWVKRIGTTRWLMAFGKYSYTIYVIHIAVFGHLVQLIGWADKTFGLPWNIPARVGYVLVMTAVVFGLALLSWQYIESPLLSLKRRFPY
jgi:peptidoglycan/LPS O-acetylase OafA/YrhL